MLVRAVLVGEHEGKTVRVVVRECKAAQLEGVDDPADEDARCEVGEAARGDEHARQPGDEAVIDKAAEYRILLDDQDAEGALGGRGDL